MARRSLSIGGRDGSRSGPSRLEIEQKWAQLRQADRRGEDVTLDARLEGALRRVGTIEGGITGHWAIDESLPSPLEKGRLTDAILELAMAAHTKGNIVTDSGTGRLALPVWYHLATSESEEAHRIYGIDVRPSELERGRRIVSYIGLQEKVEAIEASISSLPRIVEEMGRDGKPITYLFKDVLGVVDPELIDPLMKDLASLLLSDERAVLNLPIHKGPAFELWKRFPQTPVTLPTGETGVACQPAVEIRIGDVEVGTHFPTNVPGFLHSRSFFDLDAVTAALETVGLGLTNDSPISVIETPKYNLSTGVKELEEPHEVIALQASHMLARV